MRVPFLDLRAQYESIKPQIDAAISSVIAESAFIKGPHVERFEKSFGAYVGARHCIGVGNGTDAIYLALRALGIGLADEVITVANSFIATSEAISHTGARVVFVDCDEANWNISTDAVRRAITARTRAIVPVHLYGRPADLDGLSALAREHGLWLVEDAAQAHGAKFRNRRVGTFGICGCFSFFPGKNLGAFGDAGAIVTDDDELARKLRMLANHGRLDKYNHLFEGVNSRLDGLQAAVLYTKLPHLDAWNLRRREIARIYDAELGELAMRPPESPEIDSANHLYVLRVADRDAVQAKLHAAGIVTGIHYPIPLPLLKAYSPLGYTPEQFPVSSQLSGEILSLPMDPMMSDEQADYVIRGVREAAATSSELRRGCR